MGNVTRRKVQINSTVSPYLAKELDEGMEAEDYSSQSDAVSIALAEHFVRKEQREYEKKMAELYSVLIKNQEGRKLLDEVPRTTRDKIDAFKKAGIAHVEAGEYDKANECFVKAKELESQDTPQPKKEEQPGNKAQVLFGGDPKDYSPTTILD